MLRLRTKHIDLARSRIKPLDFESNALTVRPLRLRLPKLMNCPQKITLSLHTNYETALQVFFSFVTVTLDDFCPSLVIQVMPNSTPAEILIVTVGKRNGIFQVSLGNGEGESKVWCKTSEPFQIRHLSRQENE